MTAEEELRKRSDRMMICRELAERAFEELCEESNRGSASIRLSYAKQALNEAIGHARALGRTEEVFALEDRLTEIQRIFRQKYP